MFRLAAITLMVTCASLRALTLQDYLSQVRARHTGYVATAKLQEGPTVPSRTVAKELP